MKNKKKYIIAIDQGSTSTKSIIYDNELNSIASSQVKLDEIYPNDGWVELDPIKIIESVTKTVTSALIKSNVHLDEILSIGITNQRETVVFWDKKNLKPFRNAISWQCLRGVEICEKLKRTKFEKIYNLSTGLKLDPYFSFSKIIWALENDENIKTALKNKNLNIGTIDSWIMANLIGNETHKIEITNASRTGLFNTNTEEWDEELLSFIGLDKSALPKILSSNENFGNTKKLIFGKSFPVNAILGDQQSSLYGHKEKNSFEIKCTFGTGGFLLIDTEEKRFDFNKNFLSTIAYKKDNKTMHALEGSILSAGSTLEWLKKINIIKSFKDLDKDIKSSKFNKVLVIPALNGLGAPFWNSNIRASIENINASTTKQEIIRSTFESIAFSTKAIIDSIEETIGINIKELKIDGGLSKSSFFGQLLSDLINTKIKVSINSEITSMGVAKLALENSRMNSKYKNLYNEFKPNSKNKGMYNSKYKKWKNLILKRIQES